MYGCVAMVTDCRLQNTEGYRFEVTSLVSNLYTLAPHLLLWLQIVSYLLSYKQLKYNFTVVPVFLIPAIENQLIQLRLLGVGDCGVWLYQVRYLYV